ncbi:MAG: hypothetical protein Q4B60_07580 [Erysipelotrichaceae bacterium]|nr:hypothetical protein [Erysipelotrichaceae bacterium]
MQEFKHLSEHLYVYTFGEETDRPNLFYIKGKDYSVAIDAGNSKRHLDSFYNELTKHNLPLPEKTIISHWHWDHSFAIPYAQGKTISSVKTYEKLREVSKWEWTKEAMEKRLETKEDIPFCHEFIQKEYPDLNEIKVKLPGEYIDIDTIYDLGDIKVYLYPKDSTHSRDSIFVYLPSEEALIVQDADNVDFYHGEVYFQDKLKEMINFFESIDYKYHYLGHDERCTKEEALDYLRGYLL